ncbi:MAG TPA: hypothetical protein VGW38_08630 [Chloroflexota bacterium]|nr:hypothetical protein [Chloroflexota bacterium]
MHRVPTEGEARDIDGTTIQVLLHVVGGYLSELELYRVSDNQPFRLPDPQAVELAPP